jgi:hypothetical protein
MLCHPMLALVSHDACCMWHECMAGAMHREATTNKIQESFRSQTDSDRNSFAANRNRPTARLEAERADTVECPKDGTKACPSAQRLGYAKAASCGTQCARSSSPSTTTASSFSSMVSRTAHQTRATRATTPGPALLPTLHQALSKLGDSGALRHGIVGFCTTLLPILISTIRPSQRSGSHAPLRGAPFSRRRIARAPR